MVDSTDETESIEDLINTIKDPEQREQAMELLSSVLELHDEKADLEESIAELESDIKRLNDEKEAIGGAENN